MIDNTQGNGIYTDQYCLRGMVSSKIAPKTCRFWSGRNEKAIRRLPKPEILLGMKESEVARIGTPNSVVSIFD